MPASTDMVRLELTNSEIQLILHCLDIHEKTVEGRKRYAETLVAASVCDAELSTTREAKERIQEQLLNE